LIHSRNKRGYDSAFGRLTRQWRGEVNRILSEHWPLLNALLNAITIEDRQSRQLAVMALERKLSEIDERLRLERKLSKDDDGIGLLELWKELIQFHVLLQASHPASALQLANLAARHLLDGFSLELVDGDASSINGPWINDVMV